MLLYLVNFAPLQNAMTRDLPTLSLHTALADTQQYWTLQGQATGILTMSVAHISLSGGHK